MDLQCPRQESPLGRDTGVGRRGNPCFPQSRHKGKQVEVNVAFLKGENSEFRCKNLRKSTPKSTEDSGKKINVQNTGIQPRARRHLENLREADDCWRPR